MNNVEIFLLILDMDNIYKSKVLNTLNTTINIITIYYITN